MSPGSRRDPSSLQPVFLKYSKEICGFGTPLQELRVTTEGKLIKKTRYLRRSDDTLNNKRQISTIKKILKENRSRVTLVNNNQRIMQTKGDNFQHQVFLSQIVRTFCSLKPVGMEGTRKLMGTKPLQSQ